MGKLPRPDFMSSEVQTSLKAAISSMVISFASVSKWMVRVVLAGWGRFSQGHGLWYVVWLACDGTEAPASVAAAFTRSDTPDIPLADLGSAFDRSALTWADV